MKIKFSDIISILSPGEKKKFYSLVVLDLLVSLLDIAFLVALLYVVGFYTKTYQAETIFFLQVSVFEKNPLLLISVFFVLFALKNLFGYLVTRMQFRFVYKVASRISEDNLKKYLQSDFNEYISVDSSVQIRKISQQPIEYSHHVLRGLQTIISNTILLVITIIPILIFSSTMFLLLVLVLIPPVMLTIIFTKKKLAAIRAGGKENREKAIQHLQEALSGFVEINIFQQKDFFIRRYARFQDKFNESLAELQVVQSLPSKLMEVFAVFGLFVLVTATTLLGIKDSLHVLLIGGFMAAAYKIIPGIVKILNSREQIKTYGFTVEDLLLIKPETPGVANLMEDFIEKIECRNLSFSYKEKKVIDHISFQLKRTDFAGLSGISGAGKTTLLNILLGFLEQEQGEIKFNEKATTNADRRTYWNRISYARQQPFFMHESIRTNILFDQGEETERLEKILKVTGLDKMLSEIQGGINSLLSENAKNISGGQRQRIIMARTLYKDADLYIFDEPFNELDRDSSNALLSYLQTLAASGKIILLVTHDASSLSWCNQLISVHES